MKSTAVTSGLGSSTSADLSRVSLFSFGSAEKAKGTILILPGAGVAREEAPHQAQFLKGDFHLCTLLNPERPESLDDFDTYIDTLAAALEVEKLKRITAVGIGDSALFALALTARHRELVRRVMLVSPVFPAVPSGGWLGAVDRFIPFGLPLAFERSSRDIRTYAHRVRCPSLLLHGAEEPNADRSRSDFLAGRMPNARTKQLKHPLYAADGALSLEVCKHVREFIDVPAKRSQKNG